MRVLKYFTLFFCLWSGDLMATNPLIAKYDEIIPGIYSVKPRTYEFFQKKYQEMEDKKDFKTFFHRVFQPMEGEHPRDSYDIYMHSNNQTVQGFETFLTQKFGKNMWDFQVASKGEKPFSIAVHREDLQFRYLEDSIKKWQEGPSENQAFYESCLEKLCQDDRMFEDFTHFQYKKIEKKTEKEREILFVFWEDLLSRIHHPTFQDVTLWDFLVEMIENRPCPSVKTVRVPLEQYGHSIQFKAFEKSFFALTELTKEKSLCARLCIASLESLVYEKKNGSITQIFRSLPVVSYMNHKAFQAFAKSIALFFPQEAKENVFLQNFPVDFIFEESDWDIGSNFTIDLNLSFLSVLYGHRTDFHDPASLKNILTKVFKVSRAFAPEEYGLFLNKLGFDDTKVFREGGGKNLRYEMLGFYQNKDPNFYEKLSENHPFKSPEGQGIYEDFMNERQNKKKRKKKKKPTEIQEIPDQPKATEIVEEKVDIDALAREIEGGKSKKKKPKTKTKKPTPQKKSDLTVRTQASVSPMEKKSLDCEVSGSIIMAGNVAVAPGVDPDNSDEDKTGDWTTVEKNAKVTHKGQAEKTEKVEKKVPKAPAKIAPESVSPSVSFHPAVSEPLKADPRSKADEPTHDRENRENGKTPSKIKVSRTNVWKETGKKFFNALKETQKKPSHDEASETEETATDAPAEKKKEKPEKTWTKRFANALHRQVFDSLENPAARVAYVLNTEKILRDQGEMTQKLLEQNYHSNEAYAKLWADFQLADQGWRTSSDRVQLLEVENQEIHQENKSLNEKMQEKDEKIQALEEEIQRLRKQLEQQGN